MATFVSVQQSDLLRLLSSSACNSSDRYESRFAVSFREGYCGKFMSRQRRVNIMEYCIKCHFSGFNIPGTISAVLCVLLHSVDHLRSTGSQYAEDSFTEKAKACIIRKIKTYLTHTHRSYGYLYNFIYIYYV